MRCVACRPSISITDELVFGIYPACRYQFTTYAGVHEKSLSSRSPRDRWSSFDRNVAIQSIPALALTAVVSSHGDIAHVSRSDSVHEEPGFSDKRKTCRRTSVCIRVTHQDDAWYWNRQRSRNIIVPVWLIVRRGNLCILWPAIGLPNAYDRCHVATV